MTRPDTGLRPHRRDAVAGMVTAIGGTVLFTAAQQIERLPGDTEVIGPATFPTVLSVVLVGAGLALCLNGLRNRRAAGGDVSDGDATADGGQDESVPWRRLLVMVVAFATYCVAFIPVGFLISTFAFLTLVASLVDAARWKRNVLFALGFSVAVYVTFTQLLVVELPAGVFG